MWGDEDEDSELNRQTRVALIVFFVSIVLIAAIGAVVYFYANGSF